MSDTTHTPRPSALGVTHPLDLLTPAEISAARAVLEKAGLLLPSTRFPRVLPVEPSKSVVLRHVEGDDEFDRSLDITLLDTDTGRTRRAVVSVTAGEVRSLETLPTGEHPYGQAQYLFEEYDRAAEIVKADPRWQEAMARRGDRFGTRLQARPGGAALGVQVGARVGGVAEPDRLRRRRTELAPEHHGDDAGRGEGESAGSEQPSQRRQGEVVTSQPGVEAADGEREHRRNAVGDDTAACRIGLERCRTDEGDARRQQGHGKMGQTSHEGGKRQ